MRSHFAGEYQGVKFGLYLVRKRIITAEQVVDALEAQHAKSVPIGQLAIEERMMSARDVFHVLHFQRRRPEPWERFGEIAIKMGLITQDELQSLLLLQMDRKLPLREVLVRHGVLTQLEVERHLAAYRGERDRRKKVTTRHLPAPHAPCGKVPKMPDVRGVLDESELYALMS